MAGQVSADYWTGQCAMAGYVTRNMTSAEIQTIRNLYKTTLGQGLGLP
jgi:hypothetical protein